MSGLCTSGNFCPQVGQTSVIFLTLLSSDFANSSATLEVFIPSLANSFVDSYSLSISAIISAFLILDEDIFVLTSSLLIVYVYL